MAADSAAPPELPPAAPPELPPAGAPEPAVRALACPSCGGTVALRAAGYTVHVACSYCGAILDVTDAIAKRVADQHRLATTLDIPLGTRGTLRGVEWEVIGYLMRVQQGEGWDEYLLFNPYHGYRWLTNVRNGWSFGTMLTRMPRAAGLHGVDLDGHRYAHFCVGSATVRRVVGEFYWRVRVGDVVDTADYVRPGVMLSRESDGAEVNWTRNELLPPREVAAAFGVAPAGPVWLPLGHQPSPWGRWPAAAATVMGVAVVVLLLLAVMLGHGGWAARGSLAIAPDGHEQTATLGPIRFDRPYQRVDIRAEVPDLENGWVDLDYRLVDRASQRSFVAGGAAERYAGVDSDGTWTEGDRTSSVSIAGVPAGTYDLVIDYKGNRWPEHATATATATATGTGTGTGWNDPDWMAGDKAPRVTIAVRYGTLFASNVLIALILIALPWLVGFALHRRFERARLSQSDFAPAGDEA